MQAEEDAETIWNALRREALEGLVKLEGVKKVSEEFERDAEWRIRKGC